MYQCPCAGLGTSTSTWTSTFQHPRVSFTIVDRTSRCWPEAIPITTTTTVDCANTLFQGWVSRFGVPAVITSELRCPVHLLPVGRLVQLALRPEGPDNSRPSAVQWFDGMLPPPPQRRAQGPLRRLLLDRPPTVDTAETKTIHSAGVSGNVIVSMQDGDKIKRQKDNHHHGPIPFHNYRQLPVPPTFSLVPTFNMEFLFCPRSFMVPGARNYNFKI
jgi:hypothetical protein